MGAIECWSNSSGVEARVRRTASGSCSITRTLLSGRPFWHVAALLSLGDQGSQPVHIDLRASVGVALGIGASKKRRHLWAIKSGDDFLQSSDPTSDVK